MCQISICKNYNRIVYKIYDITSLYKIINNWDKAQVSKEYRKSIENGLTMDLRILENKHR